MAQRPQSKIMTAAELKVEKKAVKVEISAHALQVKNAERAVKDAKKALDLANKAAEAALITAQKTHVAALKAASKAFDTVAKEQNKIIGSATKLGLKAEAKADALTPPVMTITPLQPKVEPASLTGLVNTPAKTNRKSVAAVTSPDA